MNRLRKILTTGAIASMISVGALAATTTEAGAYTACNRYGECGTPDSATGIRAQSGFASMAMTGVGAITVIAGAATTGAVIAIGTTADADTGETVSGSASRK